MKFAKFWHKSIINEPELQTTIYSSSDISQADAEERCQSERRRVIELVRQEGIYSYNVDGELLREPILHTLEDDAVITLNRYGAQVLNISNMAILDIDHYPFLPGCFAAVFMKNHQWEPKAIQHIERVAEAQHVGLRLYRTAKGLRAILLDDSYDPRSAQCQSLMKAFRVDPRYAQMCHTQNCFRARLTPKPYRIMNRNIPAKFPYTAQEEKDVQAWLKRYQAASNNYRSCEFIGEFGKRTSSATRFKQLIDFHDQCARITEDLPLA